MSINFIEMNAKLREIAALMSNDVDYDARIEAINANLMDIQEQMESLINQALADGRDLTEDEDNLHKRLDNDFKKQRNEVKRLESLKDNASFLRQSNGAARPAPNNPEPQNNGGGYKAKPAPNGKDVIETGNALRNSNGFRHFGEFAKQVIVASAKGVNPNNIDPRLLVNAPTTFSQEGTGADGGFLVPPEYRDAIMKKVIGEDSLLSMCDQFNTEKNSIVVPKDETTPWGTSGIQAYWEGEADQMTQVKPVFGQTSARLNKLTALVPVTEEMLEDSPLIGSYLNTKAPEVITDKINDAIINGTGAGQPLGIMNSNSLITVAKETSQVADTIYAENIDKMWARMHAPSWRNAVWLINQDIMPELDNMVRLVKNVAGTENVGGLPAYMPPNGLSGSPYGTLKGRPVMPIQAMQTLGDLGDIALVDLSKYMAATKAGGIRSDVSMHLWFDYDMACFKFRFRMAGQPWFDAAITPKNSTNTLSPFVTLAARA